MHSWPGELPWRTVSRRAGPAGLMPWRACGGPCHTDGVSWYADQILPRAINLLMRGGEFTGPRARVAAGLDGEVLEIGFGSGLNIPYYPAGLKRVQAVDPATAGRKLAARRSAASFVPIEYVGSDAEALPVAAASVDHVLSTWTLCTIPDAKRALAEVRRVLRPGGALRFVEHGLAPDRGVARLQQRLTPLQRRAFGGCHLDRRIDQLVAAAGLELTRLDTYYMKGPRPLAYTFEGVAVRP
jgi:ubiquinone/menaquinone biosynthesis C-methylase UbiE